MKLTRPAGTFAALVCATLAFAFASSLAGGAQESAATPEAATTAIAATPPAPSPTPHQLKPIIFVRPTPWKYGDPGARKPTPIPALKKKAKPKAKKPAVKTKIVTVPIAHVTPSASYTLSPSRSVEPEPAATARAVYATPKPRTTPTPSPSPSAMPSPVATPTVAATNTAAIASRSGRGRAARSTPSPAPSAAATAQQLQINDGTLPYATPPPNDNGAPTPIPTQPPTPRPLAPSQPTIPDSMSDPNVRGIIARPIRQLSQVGWMQGTWSVTGVTNKEDGTTTPLEPTTYVFSPIMQNRWMFGADGKANDYIYLTFDPFERHWVALRFGSSPNYGMWTSEKGWVGNRIDFITNFSYVNGRQYRRRLTIIHKDARTFGIYETEQTPDGSFIPDDAYEFKKL